jgi:hypothetical protein
MAAKPIAAMGRSYKFPQADRRACLRHCHPPVTLRTFLGWMETFSCQSAAGWQGLEYWKYPAGAENKGFRKVRRANCFTYRLTFSSVSAYLSEAVNTSAVPVRVFCNYLSH